MCAGNWGFIWHLTSSFVHVTLSPKQQRINGSQKIKTVRIANRQMAFPLFFRLLIGQCVHTLWGYVATCWFFHMLGVLWQDANVVLIVTSAHQSNHFFFFFFKWGKVIALMQILQILCGCSQLLAATPSSRRRPSLWRAKLNREQKMNKAAHTALGMYVQWRTETSNSARSKCPDESGHSQRSGCTNERCCLIFVGKMKHTKLTVSPCTWMKSQKNKNKKSLGAASRTNRCSTVVSR